MSNINNAVNLFQRTGRYLQRRTGDALRWWNLVRDSSRASRRLAAGQRGLFIDCGSNVGQGFQVFERHFPLKKFDYVLIEPNVYCLPELENLIASRSSEGKLSLVAKAASTKEGVTQFFGLNQGGRDHLSTGGSTLKEHNSQFYLADDALAMDVPTFSLADFIIDKAAAYDTIVMKMDIEGAECDVLEDMIARKACGLLQAVYVEFHSQYMSEPHASQFRAREQSITRKFAEFKVPLTLWV